MKLLIFALIPLILSMGIAPALQSDFIPESQATKSKGNSLTETGSKKVCGDRLCSEIKNDNLYVSTETAIDKLEKQEPKSLEIELPPYPDQLPIHPKLLATNDFWFPPAVHKVTDGVYSAVGYDLANSIMIEGNDGIIIVDTGSSYESAKK